MNATSVLLDPIVDEDILIEEVESVFEIDDSLLCGGCKGCTGCSAACRSIVVGPIGPLG